MKKSDIKKRSQKRIFSNEEIFASTVEDLWAPYEMSTTIKLNTADVDENPEKIPHLFELSDFLALAFSFLDTTTDVEDTRTDLIKVMLTHDKYYFKVGKFLVSVHLVGGSFNNDEILVCEFETLSQVKIKRALARAYAEYCSHKKHRKISRLFC